MLRLVVVLSSLAVALPQLNIQQRSPFKKIEAEPDRGSFEIYTSMQVLIVCFDGHRVILLMGGGGSVRPLPVSWKLVIIKPQNFFEDSMIIQFRSTILYNRV